MAQSGSRNQRLCFGRGKEEKENMVMEKQEMNKFALALLAFAIIIQAGPARAEEPKQIINGEYVIAEINTQENAIDIQEAPPINDISEVLDALDNNPYLGITFTDDEAQELRWVLALAAQGEGFEGEICCCEVIFNRILSHRDWGQKNGLHGVLSMKGQFTEYRYINSRKAWAVPGQMEDDAISECMRRGPSSLPDIHYVYFDTGKKNGKRNIKIGNHWFGAEE